MRESTVTSPFFAAIAPEAFDALEWVVADLGGSPCLSANDCMAFAPRGAGQCDLCADPERTVAQAFAFRAATLGDAFAGGVPLVATPGTGPALRKRLLACLRNAGERLDPSSRFGAPAWAAAAASLSNPMRGHESLLWTRLEALLNTETRGHEVANPTPGEELAASLIDLMLEAVIVNLPAPEPNDAAEFIRSANLLLSVHWQIAIPLRCSSWGAEDSLPLAPLVGWANCLTAA